MPNSTERAVAGNEYNRAMQADKLTYQASPLADADNTVAVLTSMRPSNIWQTAKKT